MHHHQAIASFFACTAINLSNRFFWFRGSDDAEFHESCLLKRYFHNKKFLCIKIDIKKVCCWKIILIAQLKWCNCSLELWSIMGVLLIQRALIEKFQRRRRSALGRLCEKEMKMITMAIDQPAESKKKNDRQGRLCHHRGISVILCELDQLDHRTMGHAALYWSSSEDKLWEWNLFGVIHWVLLWSRGDTRDTHYSKDC